MRRFVIILGEKRLRTSSDFYRDPYFQNHGKNPLRYYKPAVHSSLLACEKKNLENFHNAGFSLISVNPNVDTMQYLNKNGFIDMGFPYYGWLTAVQSIPVRFALNFGINLIFYGEDGEVEYGGSKETHINYSYDVEYMKKIYLEGGYEQRIKNAKEKGFRDIELYQFPDSKLHDYSNLKITHWSYFENWDPYRNYITAKNHCGLIEAEEANSGTFTNFAQNDQALYALHTYLMYLKFGFGRANQDACIEIRRGAMDREQAVNLVNLYDGKYPEEFIDIYLEYYDMTKEEFDMVLDKWANKNLFNKENGIWEPNFVVK